MLRALSIGILMAPILAACQGTELDKTDDQTSEPEILTCPAYSPRDGDAWIDKMPGPGATPTLHINFTVDAPNDGDEYDLVLDSVQESAPPSYIYSLVRIKEGASRVVTETPVSYSEGDFAEPQLRSVIITCGDSKFYEIEPVRITH